MSRTSLANLLIPLKPSYLAAAPEIMEITIFPWDLTVEQMSPHYQILTFKVVPNTLHAVATGITVVVTVYWHSCKDKSPV